MAAFRVAKLKFTLEQAAKVQSGGKCTVIHSLHLCYKHNLRWEMICLVYQSDAY